MANEFSNFRRGNQEDDKLVEIYQEILRSQDDNYLPDEKALLQILNTKVSHLEPKEKKSKRLQNFLRISIMLLAGTSTVLLGLRLGEETWLGTNLDDIVLILTAAITFLSSLAIFWDIDSYWIRNKVMLNRLKKLRYEYVVHLINSKTPDGQTTVSGKYLQEFIDVIGDEYWENLLNNRRPDNNGTNK